MRQRHLVVERRHVVLLRMLLLKLLMLELVRVHCLRLVHPLLRRMIHGHWRQVLRSACWRSLHGGVLLLLLRVGSSELVAGWLWLWLLVLLSLGLAGSTLLVRRGSILLSFFDHGSYHRSRDAEFVAVAVEDHGGVGRREMVLVVVHEGAAGRFGDGAAVGCVVLVAEGGGDEGGAEGWLLLLVLLLLLLLLRLFDGLEVWRRLDCVEVWRVDVRCEVRRQSWIERG
jgi:hypothetical protein